MAQAQHIPEQYNIGLEDKEMFELILMLRHYKRDYKKNDTLEEIREACEEVYAKDLPQLKVREVKLEQGEPEGGDQAGGEGELHPSSGS